MTRISAPAAAGFALFVSILSAQFLPFMDQDSSTTATAQAFRLLGDSLKVLLPLAVMEATLLAAAYYANRHVAGAEADGAGAANRRLSISELAAFISCVAVGILEFSLFAQPASDVAGGGAPARAVGLAALLALPASATVTFLLGIALVYAHVGAGGGNGPVPELAVRILAEITLEAAATLVCIMAMAIYIL